MKIPVWLKPGLWRAAFGGIAMAIVGFSQLGWKTAASADNLAQERSDAAFLSLGWRSWRGIISCNGQKFMAL